MPFVACCDWGPEFVAVSLQFKPPQPLSPSQITHGWCILASFHPSKSSLHHKTFVLLETSFNIPTNGTNWWCQELDHQNGFSVVFDLESSGFILPAHKYKMALVWRRLTPLWCPSQGSKIRELLYFSSWKWLYLPLFFGGYVLNI